MMPHYSIFSMSIHCKNFVSQQGIGNYWKKVSWLVSELLLSLLEKSISIVCVLHVLLSFYLRYNCNFTLSVLSLIIFFFKIYILIIISDTVCICFTRLVYTVLCVQDFCFVCVIIYGWGKLRRIALYHTE